MKIIHIFLFTTIFCLQARAQTDTTWNGHRCAVVLTYDDGLDVDLSNAVPALDSAGLKGTFYISDYFNGLSRQIPLWKRAAAEGHELANHTVWHPCTGGPGRDFVKDYDLRTYTVGRITDEIRTMNNLLFAMDGKRERTFAFPCGDTRIHDTAYIDGLRGDFVAARGVEPNMPTLKEVDLYNVGCYTINGQSGDELVNLVKAAMQKRSLLVFLFHGVGGGHGLNVSLDAHHQLLQFLRSNQKQVWVAPMIDVALFIRDRQRLTSRRTFPQRGLKDEFSIPIGVAVAPSNLRGEEADFIRSQFNSLTPENAMKMGPIHPRPDQYNWRDADSIMAFAERNGLRVRGHNLCWHNQAPSWFFTDFAGRQVSKEELLRRLRDHIHTVVGRYKGRIYAWDVVNEAISDKPGEYLRPSKWLEICGEEYIARAFQYAHEADPNAILFYNDYNEINPVKREKMYRLIKSLKDAGVPIGGIGLQGHWAVNEPGRGQLDSTLARFAELGLPIQITELDISVYPKEHEARTRRAGDADTAFTAAKADAQARAYFDCFEVFKKYRRSITGITFWNVSDRSSWLDDFPVRGRKDHPLLFDAALQPKKAYYEVLRYHW